MKYLKIDDRVIVFLEDGEIISQSIYEEIDDIPYDLYELLSKFQKIGEIKIELEIELSKNILEAIEDIVKSKDGIILREEKRFNLNLKFFLIPVILQLIFVIFIWRDGIKKKDKIGAIEKEIKVLDKKIVEEREKIQRYSVYRSSRYNFPKYKIVKNLKKISNIFKGRGYIQQFEIKNGKLNIYGFSDNLESCFDIKNELENEFGVKKVQFDYLKKEGEGLFFLIELKIE